MIRKPRGSRRAPHPLHLVLPLLMLAASHAVLPIAAQAPPTSGWRPISLAEALRRQAAGSLHLRLAQEEIAAAEARRVAAGLFLNPAFSITREQLSSSGAGYDETVVALGQTLELGGQRGARRLAADADVRAAEARLEAERIGVTFALHEAYVRTALAEANLAVVEEATAIFRTVEQTGQARFVEGDISRFDRNRLQIEWARYEGLLARAALQREAAARELTMLTDPDSVGATGLLIASEPLDRIAVTEQTIDLPVALASAERRADVRAALVEVESARAAVTAARRERTPDLTVSGGLKHQADGYRGAVLGLSLPLPLWSRNEGPIAEAEALLAAALAREALVRRGAENEIRRAWGIHRSLVERTRTLGGSLLPESAGLLETARIAYAEGEMSLLELLDAADAYRLARETVNELLADYLIANWELQRATGILPTITASATEAAPERP